MTQNPNPDDYLALLFAINCLWKVDLIALFSFLPNRAAYDPRMILVNENHLLNLPWALALYHSCPRGWEDFCFSIFPPHFRMIIFEQSGHLNSSPFLIYIFHLHACRSNLDGMISDRTKTFRTALSRQSVTYCICEEEVKLHWADFLRAEHKRCSNSAQNK